MLAKIQGFCVSEDMDDQDLGREPSLKLQSEAPASSSEVVQNGTTMPMVLLSVAQRNSLIEYMAKQPYQDVANGIDFLRNAPVVNVTVTEDERTSDAADS